MTPAYIAVGAVVLLALIAVAKTIRIVPQARAGIVERLGRYNRTLNPGLTVLIPFIDKLRPLIDLREQVVSFPPAAGHHRGQPGRRHRHRHLLPGDQRDVRNV